MSSNLNLLSEVAVVLRNWEEEKRWIFDEFSVVADFIRFCAAKKSKSDLDSFPIVPRKKRSSLRRRPNKKTSFGFSSIPIIIPKKKRSLRRRAAACLGMTSTNLKRKRLSGCESSTNNDGVEGFLLQKKQKIVDLIHGCNAGTSNRHSVSSVICPPFTAVELIRKIWYVVFDGVYPGNIPHELDPPADVAEL
ncbi:hypothetical protein ACFX1S_044456 [Malus domestica]